MTNRRWATLVGAIAVLLFVAPAAEAQQYGFVKGWGSKGSRNGQLGFIGSLATDRAGNVYAADGNNSRVQVFNRNGRFLRKWPTPGYEIATDRFGNVYVADFTIVRKFTSTGRFLAQWTATDTMIHALATDGAGNVYVAVTSPQIVKFTSTGAFITQWGGLGASNGSFVSISGVATDAAGNVYVTDGGPSQIQKFTSNGGFLTQWGRRGTRNGQLRDAHGVATDGRSNVYVVDGKNQRVQKFNSNGRFLAKWGSCCFGDGRFRFPRGITVGAGGAVYVASDNRIQKFAPRPARPRARTCTKPARTTRSRRACFRFRSRTARVRFQCRLTGKGVARKHRRWRRCKSPQRYGGLRPGKKRFQVRAVSSAGATSPPARHGWRVTG